MRAGAIAVIGCAWLTDAGRRTVKGDSATGHGPLHRVAIRRRETRADGHGDRGSAHLDCGPISRARSSAGERSPHTREVAGSKPAAPMWRMARFRGPFGL